MHLPGRDLFAPLVRSAAGTKYEGDGVLFWTMGKDALLEIDGQSFEDCRYGFAQRALAHPSPTATLDEQISFYVGRLGDPSYFEWHEVEPGEFTQWYTAAERLSSIGAPALPSLVQALRATEDTYELTILFYALSLCAQDPVVKYGLGLERPHHLAAYPDPADHDELRQRWLSWWDEHGERIAAVPKKAWTSRSGASDGAGSSGTLTDYEIISIIDQIPMKSSLETVLARIPTLKKHRRDQWRTTVTWFGQPAEIACSFRAGCLWNIMVTQRRDIPAGNADSLFDVMVAHFNASFGAGELVEGADASHGFGVSATWCTPEFGVYLSSGHHAEDHRDLQLIYQFMCSGNPESEQHWRHEWVCD